MEEHDKGQMTKGNRLEDVVRDTSQDNIRVPMQQVYQVYCAADIFSDSYRAIANRAFFGEATPSSVSLEAFREMRRALDNAELINVASLADRLGMERVEVIQWLEIHKRKRGESLIHIVQSTDDRGREKDLHLVPKREQERTYRRLLGFITDAQRWNYILVFGKTNAEVVRFRIGSHPASVWFFYRNQEYPLSWLAEQTSQIPVLGALLQSKYVKRLHAAPYFQMYAERHTDENTLKINGVGLFRLAEHLENRYVLQLRYHDIAWTIGLHHIPSAQYEGRMRRLSPRVHVSEECARALLKQIVKENHAEMLDFRLITNIGGWRGGERVYTYPMQREEALAEYFYAKAMAKGIFPE
ncbi:hypothetical protein HYS48_05025 [Candidatus Woesearchaeota archaeon]|nr:hypothetical protein [Candidatus Woesearchaeota archaeon]